MKDGNSSSSSFDAGQPPGSHIHGHGGGRCRKKKEIVKRKPLTPSKFLPLIEDSEESFSSLSDDLHWQKEQENDS